MKTKLILSMMLLLGLSIGANAQYMRGKDGVQKDRIEDGRRNGDLSKGDAFKPSNDRRHMRKDGRRFKHHDGRVGAHGKKHMRHEKRHGHRTHRNKHNHHNRFD
jgi:hypothetical protein